MISDTSLAERGLEIALITDAPLSFSRGQAVVHPSRAEYFETVDKFKRANYVTCSDLCAVDYLSAKSARPLPEGVSPERFEVVVSLLCLERLRRIRLRVQVPESDLNLATLFSLYPGTENMEREVFD